MLLNFYNSFKTDKSIEHPLLGEITCSGYHEAFKKCQEAIGHKTNLNIQCYNLHDISMYCYRSSNETEFLEWIDKKLDERKRLNEFLKENGSIQPRLQSRNMFYDVFINSDGMKQENQAKHEEEINAYYRDQMMKNKTFFEDDKEEHY